MLQVSGGSSLSRPLSVGLHILRQHQNIIYHFCRLPVAGLGRWCFHPCSLWIFYINNSILLQWLMSRRHSAPTMVLHILTRLVLVGLDGKERSSLQPLLWIYLGLDSCQPSLNVYFYTGWSHPLTWSYTSELNCPSDATAIFLVSGSYGDLKWEKNSLKLNVHNIR